MELSEFVRQSLVAIVRGVETAAKDLSDSTAEVNPANTGYSTDGGIKRGHVVTKDKRVELIAFDVAVTANESEINKTGGGVSIAVIAGGMTGTSAASNRRESRIQFSVPLCLPIGEDKEESKGRRRRQNAE